MSIEAGYMGMNLELNDVDAEFATYFRHAAEHEFRLQQCLECRLLRFPPSTGCVWCASTKSQWTAVEGKGTVHSYSEVRHAINRGFAKFTPYLLLLVELDTQKASPTPHEAIRVVGNLTTPDGTLASPEEVLRVGIGTRVRMVFTDVAPGLSLPQWTIDEGVPQPEPWRYPEKTSAPS